MSRTWAALLALAAVAGFGWLLLDNAAPSSTSRVAPTTTTTLISVPSLVAVDCRQSSGGLRTDCYDVFLPESRSVHSDAYITLHVAVVRGAEHAPSDPVIFLHGGPAVPAMAKFLSEVDHGFRQMYEKRPVIVFDQRGTGAATPRLDCSFDSTYADSLGEDSSVSMIGWLANQTHDCMSVHRDSGLRLDAYATSDIAMDVADIVRLLGYPQVNLHGSSFGSRVALAFADVAEPRLVRSIVLEGPYPPSVDGVARRGEAAMSALRRLFTACRRDFSCNTTFPDLETELVKLLRQLNVAPPLVAVGADEVPVVVNSARFMEVLYRSMYTGTGLRRIPRFISETADGNFAIFEQLQMAQLPEAESIDSAGYFATVCSTTDPSSRATLAASVASLPDPIGAYFEETARSTLNICAEFALTGLAPVLAPTEIPILYITGSYDPVTPPYWAEEAAEGVWPGYVAELGYGTHTNLLGIGSCGARLAAMFAANPESPGAACVSARPRLRFDLGS